MANSFDETRLAGDVPVFHKWTVVGAMFGVTSAVTYNALQRRPFYAGIHRHAIGILIGGIIGYRVAKIHDHKLAEKLFLIEDYKRRNPEYFHEEPAKKKGEMFSRFTPIR